MNQHLPSGSFMGHGGTWSTVRTLCMGILIVAVASATEALAASTIGNPVIVTCPAGWKYKDGKKSDSIKGNEVTPGLVPYLTNGWGIGIARFDGTNYYSFVPCVPLATKNGKSWSLKIKKGISIKYSPSKGAFACTVWTQLPPTWVVYVDTLTGLYMEVDVSAGPNASYYPVTYLSSQPVLNDDYRTTKILLRKIPAGSFVMGSPVDELGRFDSETQHIVTLTKAFYMGVFEITQGQYSNVMGSNPSYFSGTVRPVDCILWKMVRGGKWPGGTPANGTFTAKLRMKTGFAFDLPTEAQWEYACRAGTTHALNNDTDLVSTVEDPNVAILGRYWYNGGSDSAHTTVGSYLVNNWGLYDMHGNTWEWCLDWYGPYPGDATDPSGALSGTERVLRGGCWYNNSYNCRSARRFSYDPADGWSYEGFRLCMPTGQ